MPRSHFSSTPSLFGHFPKITAFATTCLVLGLASAPPARAQVHLQSCTPNASNPNAILPVGLPGEAGTSWKTTLRGWLSGHTAADFSFQGRTVDIEPPHVAYGVSPTFTNMPTCENDWAATAGNLTDQDRGYLEQFYLLTNVRLQNNWREEFLHVDPAYFTLDEMEDEVTCQAKTPFMSWDGNMGRLALWQYPGNLTATDPVVSAAFKKRLGAWLALQLIMLDWASWDASGQTPPPATTATAPGRIFHHPSPLAIGGVDGNLGMGIALTAMASAYEAIKNEPWFAQSLAVQDAFTKGLLTHAERLDVAGYWAQQANRAVPMVSGQQLVYNATGDADAAGWYLNAVDRVFNGNLYFPAGYLTQDFRWDPGYSKMDTHDVVRLLANHDQNLNGGVPLLALYGAAAQMHDLRAHMSKGDRTGLFLGPSAMSTRTGSGANSNDYNPAGAPFRIETQLYAAGLGLPFADGVLRDHPDFGLYGLRGYAPNTRLIDPLDPNRDFHIALGCRFASIDNFDENPPGAWSQSDQQRVWPDAATPRNYYTPWTLVWNHALDPSGNSLFQTRALRVQNQPDTNLLPFELEGPYFRSFEDELLYAKYGGTGVWHERGWGVCLEHDEYQGSASDLAATLHTGPVVGNVGIYPFGYGGGQLASLWSPETGTAVLNRRTGRNNTGFYDNWLEWRRLPIHAATLLTNDDVWTSSSRIVDPQPQVTFTDAYPSFNQAMSWTTGSGTPAVNVVPESQAVSMIVDVGGTLPVFGHDLGGSTPLGTYTAALDPSAPIGYQRRFVVSPRLVFVRTRLDPMAGGVPNPNTFNEAWETVPLFVGITDLGPNCSVDEEFATPKIEFVTGSGAVLDMTQNTALVKNVHVVKLHRNNGTLSIVFPEGRAMRLSEIYGDTANNITSRFLLRNLMVDLLDNPTGAAAPLDPVDLVYYFHFSELEPVSGGGGGDPDSTL